MALDPSYFFYGDGTISVTNGSDIATGDLVAWDPAVLPFDFVFPNDGTAGLGVIKEVLAVDQIRLAKPWTGPTLTNVPYTMVRWTRHTDPRIYALRVSDYLTRVKDATPEIIAARDEAIAAIQAAGNASTALTKGNNLSDLPDKKQALKNLGSRWQVIAEYDASSPAAAWAFTIPADAKRLRISASVNVNSTADLNVLMGRLSLDNGATYKSASGDYTLSYVQTASGAPVGGQNVPITYIHLGAASKNPGGRRQVTAEIAPADGVAVTSWVIQGSGYTDVGPLYIAGSGTNTSAVRPTHMLVGTNDASLMIGGSSIIVEALF
jgi:hypothetical protein